MPGCDTFHAAFRTVAENADDRRRRPSRVETLAAVVVLLLVLAGNFDRWTGNADAGTPSMVTAIDEGAPELDRCREFLPGDC